MIFEEVQLCFSSDCIDDFRGINRSEGSLNAISFSKVHRQEARCFSNSENIGAISQGIIAGVIKCVRHTYTAIIKAEGLCFMSEQNHAARKKNIIQTTEVDDSAAQKERIIAAAYSIGAKQGLAAISARGVARNANVSVGYLYKLFPSKSDIMVAAAERYFEHALFHEICHINVDESYVEYCKRLWDCASEAVAVFRRDWLRDWKDLPKADLLAAQIRMDTMLEHAKSGLEKVLTQDEHIDWKTLPAEIDIASITTFTVRSMLDSLREKNADCTVLFTLLERGLYDTDRHNL